MMKVNIVARWGLKKMTRSAFVRNNTHLKVIEYINAFVPSLLAVALGLVVYEFGFKPFWSNHDAINFWLQIIMLIVSLLAAVRLSLEMAVSKKKLARVFNIAGVVFALFLTLYVLPQKASLANTETNKFLLLKLVLYGGILLGVVTEISHFLQFLYSKTLNPGILFVGSFAMLILLGAFLLKVPNAVNGRVSTLDTLFTSVSAVCVTGLIVVDTATRFTSFGQLIILLLIQVGGLGFMTLTGLLSYAVSGQSSLKSQLAFTDMMSTKRLNNVMHFVYQVVFVTLLIEGIGAALIYFSLNEQLFSRSIDKLFFSVFHSVSAFCNAGFSTFTLGLYQPEVRYNYDFQFILALLVILGGMGFPIVFNLYRYIKIRTINLVRLVARNPKREHFPNIILLNSRLALVVNMILLVFGFIAYMLFEQENTLAEHPTIVGKLATCFFGTVTPRTAGFNTVDLTQMRLPMMLIYLFLMWIGASPGSTGGGIKTTTAGVAFLNMVAILKGKDRTEFFHSEVSHQSVRRAFAIMISSLLIIAVAILLISLNDANKGLINIAFEVFSAFSTVGLSLGITAGLSTVSKIVLMITMFIGRVGTITLLVIFIRQSRPLYHRYPKEDIAF
ncbi:TrkH family potassium uptake protein [Segetibacter sp. 3557_3]|uniref:TrkH family potassium uptake protein n=1 Tax=Segetibacter sp. 3557_3 TaxID=2547429 RepID=UPI001404274C|nr:potassium transporter TrkG [Segetibacter sp. 3557_3]